MWTEAQYVDLDLEKVKFYFICYDQNYFLNIIFLGYGYIQIAKYNRRKLMGIGLF